jgi:starch phosphorylase
MYPQGYFHQRISAEGDQQEVYTYLNFDEAPISRCTTSDGRTPLIRVQLADIEVCVKIWQVRVGRVNVFLLDTDVPENRPEERRLSARLYTSDQEERLRQLIVLGVGGVRALDHLGFTPVVWHANEDHTAFMMLERLRLERSKGLSWQDAVENVRESTIFTTHTPVPAGHHVFPVKLMDRYSKNFWESVGIDRNLFLSFGQYKELDPGQFNLTAFALNLSRQSNAVSQLHGEVTRAMWRSFWGNNSRDHSLIGSITNGVHLRSWQAPEIGKLCERYVGADCLRIQDQLGVWNAVSQIPDEEVWQVHHQLKSRLINTITNKARQRLAEDHISPQQVVALGALLDPYALTIAFTRRFTEYKRPCLILSDKERLKKLITDAARPVQIVFAGKSHPADYQSKQLLKQVYQVAMDASFHGRVAFVEDYDLNIAHALTRGVDVWLNNPRRLQEACGTSGMKAAINGVLNLSVLDGWWNEAYNERNGWSIGPPSGICCQDEDAMDSWSLYDILEKEVVPLYYARDRSGVPRGWVKMMKEAMKSVIPVFNSHRMMKEYSEQMYQHTGGMQNARYDSLRQL